MIIFGNLMFGTRLATYSYLLENEFLSNALNYFVSDKSASNVLTHLLSLNRAKRKKSIDQSVI